ncbi:MAG: glutamyl-tRNA reductase [Desulfobacteraceae bacterium]|jgi:glutamyl-tRNA reductase
MDKLILIGLNHKTAPVHIRECLTFSEPETRQALAELRAQPEIEETVLFSTCNRVEILLSAKQPQGAIDAAKRFLAKFKQVALGDFETNLYLHLGGEAVRHVFRVAASLDSMVVGEPQILGQMKQAYRTATEEKTSGVVLNRLLHRTFFIAKRIRTETGVGDSAVSISYAAIELGRKIFGTLEGKQVLLIGAGEMAELAVEHLIRQRSGNIYVANRTFERGVALAKAYRGTAIRFEEIPNHLNKVDIIISSTGAAGYVLEKKDIKAVMRGRRNRPIFFIDIAVPRDIDPKINTLDNTYVYDIDDLQGVIDDNVEERRREAVKAERIIDEAVIQFRHWFESLKVVPTIKALREKVRSMAVEEVKKTMQQLPHLSKDDQKAIERLIDATVNKILHHPTHYLKSNGCQGERPEALDIARKLFDLDEP